MNHRGMSLIELMVAVGILSTVLAGTAILFYNQNRTIRAIENKTNAAELMQDLTLFYQDTANCKALIQANNFTSGNAQFSMSAVPTTPVSTPLSLPLRSVPDQNGNAIIDSTKVQNIASLKAANINIDLKNQIGPGSDLFNASLTVGFTGKSGAQIGGDFYRKIPLIVKVDNPSIAAPNIVDCSTSAAKLGGTPSGGALGKYTASCILGNGNINTAPGGIGGIGGSTPNVGGGFTVEMLAGFDGEVTYTGQIIMKNPSGAIICDTGVKTSPLGVNGFKAGDCVPGYNVPLNTFTIGYNLNVPTFTDKQQVAFGPNAGNVQAVRQCMGVIWQ